MGRQRAPPEPAWRRLLRSGCRGLLGLCGTALRGLRGLWSLTWVRTTQPLPHGPLRTGARRCWGAIAAALRERDPRPGLVLGPGRSVPVPSRSPGNVGLPSGLCAAQGGCEPSSPQVLLMCYKSCWDGAFQVTEQLGIALQLRLERSEEEEDVDSDSAWEPGQTVVGQQRHGDASEAVLRRLEALEADVRFLCTELGAEKLLWSSRFLELLREQQSLRQRLQELPWRWNSGDSPELLGEAEDQSASGSEGESPEGCQWMEAPQQPRGSIQRDRQKM
ncbi:chromatin modification-related protein MEAF6 isoform X3 [Poecile atricapillus]|uniref:chromatin modification-related protein MEAF6 isoform X3 n=1 Tax=Poecile atricapillus TaxID=48891 RepID=UPI0027397A2B|nr:chromatin modification-related protein MEAF6 isoform X3 [Poecile atricapillus]